MNVEQLKNRDYTLILDKSGSMVATDTAGGLSRWKSAQEASFALAHKMNEYDPDGITLYTFNNTHKRYDNTTPDKVNQVFIENEPNGGTNLAGVLEDAFGNFFKRKAANQLKANGETIVVVTDGEPNDKAAVTAAIINATKKLTTREELGLCFIQVGKDQGANAFLKKLDDELTSQGAKMDIVDAITADEAGEKSLSDVLLGAIID